MGQGNSFIYDKCCFILSMSTVSGLLKLPLYQLW